MNRTELSDWIKAEAAKGTSFRQLALSLGTSPTTLNALRDEERATISDDLLEAISFRRKETVKATAEWLGVEPPEGFDVLAKIAVLERRFVALERKVDYAYQRLSDQERIDPSLMLDTYLREHGVNVRAAGVQQQIQALMEEAGLKSPGYERFLLIVLGVIPALADDLPVVAVLLKGLTGDPWTPAEVTRVMALGR